MANKVYKVKIISVDKDTGIENVDVDSTLANVFMVGGRVENERSFTSIIMGTSVMEAASMLASGKETVPVVKLASCLIELQQRKSSDLEDDFLNAIMEG